MSDNNSSKLELMKQLDESFRQVRRQITSEWNKHNVHGLGMTHGKMLIILSESGPLNASALAEQLSITSGGVTGIADRLIDLGFIERKRGEQDRRVVMLGITDEGRKVIEQIATVRNTIMLMLFDGMSEDMMEQSLELFQLMNKNMERSSETRQ